MSSSSRQRPRGRRWSDRRPRGRLWSDRRPPLVSAAGARLLACLVTTIATAGACDSNAGRDSAIETSDDATASRAEDQEPGAARWTDRELDLESSPIPKEGRDSASVALKVTDARRAGPSSIASDASIIDRAAEEGGAMLPIRAGANDWVCVPDDPITPVDDPVCLNGVGQRWASGIYKGNETFRHGGLGVGYKLRGGAIASNTDPFLIRPAPGEDWIIEPPHVILVFQDTSGLGSLPDDPGGGGPWVSWRGTPYMHVKVPIAP